MEVVLRGEPSRLGLTSSKPTEILMEDVGYNPGNLAFSYASALILGFPRHARLLEPVLEPEKIAVFPLANCLGEHHDLSDFAEFLTQAPPGWRPVILGLGAQGLLDRITLEPTDINLPDEHLRWLRALRERADGHANISVRGDLTLRLMEHYGHAEHAVVTGCPSLMLSPNRRLGQVIARKFTSLGCSLPLLNGALGNPWNPAAAPFEQSLIRLVIDSGGEMHVQMMNDHLFFARGEALPAETIRVMHKQLMPDMPIEQFERHGRRHFRVWWDVPAWMEYLSRADFVVGARIHGTALALQSGTPALCVVWDSRTYELCRSMHIPYVSIYDEPWRSGQFGWDDIRRAFETQFDPNSFDLNRQKRAQQFQDLLEAHDVNVASHLRQLAARETT